MISILRHELFCDLIFVTLSTPEFTILQEKLCQAEHSLDVATRQVSDQESSLLLLQRDSEVALEEMKQKTMALQKNVRLTAFYLQRVVLTVVHAFYNTDP